MKNENDPKILDARRALAAAGIASIYGGCKGHGFWLMKSTTEQAQRFIMESLSLSGITGEVMLNDGARSGNPYFFIFEDAEEIARLAVLAIEKANTLKRAVQIYQTARGAWWVRFDDEIKSEICGDDVTCVFVATPER